MTSDLILYTTKDKELVAEATVKEYLTVQKMTENLFHFSKNAAIREFRTTDTAQNPAIRNFRTTAPLPYTDHFEDMRAMVSPAPFGNNSSFNGGGV